jgi:hypothetical protein
MSMKSRIVMMVLLGLLLSGNTAVREQQRAAAGAPAVTADTFVGEWTEYWPGIPQHATHTITKHGDQYQIEGESPLTPRYRISDVRMDGDCLKFSEGTATFTVEYELRVKNPQTLSVRAMGMGGWRDDIVWRRIQ